MEDTCPICLELLSEDCLEIKCNHKFHTKCLTEWLNKNNTCPYCRIKLNTDDSLNIGITLFGELFSVEEWGFNLNPEITYENVVENANINVERFLSFLRDNNSDFDFNLNSEITYEEFEENSYRNENIISIIEHISNIEHLREDNFNRSSGRNILWNGFKRFLKRFLVVEEFAHVEDDTIMDDELD